MGKFYDVHTPLAHVGTMTKAHTNTITDTKTKTTIDPELYIIFCVQFPVLLKILFVSDLTRCADCYVGDLFGAPPV